MKALFQKFGMERSSPNTGKPQRKDLAAFTLLDALVPGTNNIIACAEHDQIWLDVDLEDLAAVITESQVRTLCEAGIYIDEDNDSLAKSA
jgi:hypothetical protein